MGESSGSTHRFTFGCLHFWFQRQKHKHTQVSKGIVRLRQKVAIAFGSEVGAIAPYLPVLTQLKKFYN
ncbi:MAG: hypothetical protein RMY16_27600 [Nostoc sp. DedQUE12b]|uniref:hypothetical protein n=1 Tax=Nostoc sp. DedQUE12b TaxID=3075398 RepID=UPI002AD48CF0|nr:hypothetical protein [Nostoc sp. DedQUE12b]MDZ8089287.1 hypothetical protein [Nostoc sp. DedQUE12b]